MSLTLQSSDFFMPRAACAFWKEEGRLVEEKGSYRREVRKGSIVKEGGTS